MPIGLKPVRARLADGTLKIYWYHRATGQRLEHDPETAEGLLEVAGLDKKAAALPSAAPRTLAALWLEYRGDPTRQSRDECGSPEWRILKPRTKSDYQKVRDWLGDSANKVLVKDVTVQQVVKLRDKAFNQKGRRFSKYVVQVLSMLFGWGRLHGWPAVNPAADIPEIRRPTGQRKQNRAWSLDEVKAFAETAPFQLLVPFVLGLFAGMREGDALISTWGTYNGAMLHWFAGKNGEECFAPVEGHFKIILDEAKNRRGDCLQIAVTSRKTPWTESGFRASFFKHIRKLVEAGRMKPGCTFHGLRHTIGAGARNAGESDSRVAAAIGDKTTAMAAIYGRDADKSGAQVAVLGDTQKRFAAIDWTPPARPKPAKK